MIKGFKVKLHPNKEQLKILICSSGIARWAYNWTITRQRDNYQNGSKFIQDGELRKELTQLKHTDEYKWLNDVSAQVPKQAIIDACNAFKSFFKTKSGFPKFKRKRDLHQSFYQRLDHLEFMDDKVKLEIIGWVKLAERNRIPVGTKYLNCRIVYDGLSWWVTVGAELEDNQTNPVKTEPIGIDLGLKKLAVSSNGMIFKKPNINKERKKLKRLQKRASRYYEKIRREEVTGKSTRLIKLETQIKKQHQRIYNILCNNIHQMTSAIVKLNPEAIVIEDLNISGILKNKHLSQKIMESKFYEIHRQLQYKSCWNNVKFIVADRWFPSSKQCSVCGNIKTKLSLSERQYVCKRCDAVIDRDLNASINLKNLAS